MSLTYKYQTHYKPIAGNWSERHEPAMGFFYALFFWLDTLWQRIN